MRGVRIPRGPERSLPDQTPGGRPVVTASLCWGVTVGGLRNWEGSPLAWSVSGLCSRHCPPLPHREGDSPYEGLGSSGFTAQLPGTMTGRRPQPQPPPRPTGRTIATESGVSYLCWPISKMTTSLKLSDLCPDPAHARQRLGRI